MRTGMGALLSDQEELPYDREVKTLKSDGNQYIILNDPWTVNENAVFITKGYIQVFGYCHNMVVEGTWRVFEGSDYGSFTFYWKDFSTKYVYSWATLKTKTYRISNTEIKDCETESILTTFVLSDGTDIITDIKLPLFAKFDFYDNLYHSIKSDFDSFQKYVDGELVCDLIPVVKNETGYMYDRISKTMYSNQGTGSFTWDELEDSQSVGGGRKKLLISLFQPSSEMEVAA